MIQLNHKYSCVCFHNNELLFCFYYLLLQTLCVLWQFLKVYFCNLLTFIVANTEFITLCSRTMKTDVPFLFPEWCCSTLVPHWLTSAALPSYPACPRRARSPWTTSPTSPPSWKRSCGWPSKTSGCSVASVLTWARTAPAPARTVPSRTSLPCWEARERWGARVFFPMICVCVKCVFLGIEILSFLCGIQISPQELERRKRRRERNKVAAAKCRNKKKEKTESLQKVVFNFFHSVPCDLLADKTTIYHIKSVKSGCAG